MFMGMDYGASSILMQCFRDKQTKTPNTAVWAMTAGEQVIAAQSY